MNLLCRQISALCKKNILILIIRRPFSTAVRALIIPLLVVLVVGYSKLFLSSPDHYGVGSGSPIRSLSEALAASSGRDIVAFVDNGMKDGAIASVVTQLSRTVSGAGKSAEVFSTRDEMSRACARQFNGVSPCFGAVEFLSSPNEPIPNGTWNYTLRGDTSYGGGVDVTANNNNVQIYLLPLQHALDEEIISASQSNSSTALPSTVNNLLFTPGTESDRLQQNTNTYISLCQYVFGAIFQFAMVGLVYHLVGFIASERELGVTQLIDAMIPGGSAKRARFIRLTSTYLSFTMVYLPGWFAVGIVIGTVVFGKSPAALPIIYHLLNGLALCSFSLFGGVFFKRAQLSGAIVLVIAIVFAILPQVLDSKKQSHALTVVFSLFFPSANYTYFITTMANFEAHGTGASLLKQPPESKFEVKCYILWVLLAAQIILYPILAFLVEDFIFGTASTGRSFREPSNPQAPTVVLAGFCKTYKAGLFSRLFRRASDVCAVEDLNMKAHRGQILCLLGPNGSGKSTTLNSITGVSTLTSGQLMIDPTGGLGYAPQNNVIWNDLTVREHVQIFSTMKSRTHVTKADVNSLLEACDIQSKARSKAKTLSGGQKRKLQMAIMFAGGSAVCCIDEVSTGLDPISRRRIWDILLAERRNRTIIMTTHFLDEADFLADNIVIMYKGALRAEGSSATLKSTYGNGYTVKLPATTAFEPPASASIERDVTRNETLLRMSTPAEASELISLLEARGIDDYQVSGPTMEELFLKVTGDTIRTQDEGEKQVRGKKNSKEKAVNEDDLKGPATVTVGPTCGLTDGRPISAFQQWRLLFFKRFTILRRRYVPYIVAIAIAIIGAGIAPLLIKDMKPMQCPYSDSQVQDYNYRGDLASVATYYGPMVVGPSSKINDKLLGRLADIYSSNHTRYSDYYGFRNVSEVKDSIRLVDTYDQFSQAISKGHAFISPGGIYLSDPPTIAIQGDATQYAMMLQNIFDIFSSDLDISSGYSTFPSVVVPTVIDFSALEFCIYFGLILACYPAFFALYPTTERLSNVRSMQYSNGVRPLPLWLSHFAFDACAVLILSIVATGILSTATSVWYTLPLLGLVMFLYGITSTLLSYVLSLFAPSALAAWAMSAIGQTIFHFAYFGGLLGVQAQTDYLQMNSVMNKLYFGLAIISPAASMLRALSVSLGQFAFLCHGESSGGAVTLYGGPILYLILQAVFLFLLLLWWDSGFQMHSSLHRRKHAPISGNGVELTASSPDDPSAELVRATSSSSALRVTSVTKRFGHNVAVDNVTFGVKPSEIFALLGPNGAGKSTLISMIRGDVRPSTRQSLIEIANHDIRMNTISARANLGVCPQFDAADIMTVSETLRFFARIRGVRDISQNVAQAISACGLEPYASRLAQKLSGGTKRKLSLAIALVGNPAVLVLDEPSSALDANAKRVMWRTLQSVGSGRAIVLTTHSMEEADALADRIGIVSSRMLACGAREELKRKAGEGYHVHVVTKAGPGTTAVEAGLLKGWILEAFKGAKIERETHGGQIRFQVPVESQGGLPLTTIIRRLEKDKGTMGVEYYTVGKATLDEVFENIVKKYGSEGPVS